MENLAKAILEVMKEIKGIEKNDTVGSGSNSYKAVQDKDVKVTVGRAMSKHGLCMLPISIKPHTTVNRWEEEDSYSKSTPKAMKSKQSVFTEVETKYLLLHSSGESMEIAGFGHGVDSQDKSAGKATTYALKYALLYMFMVPTGDIDDADNTHSEEKPVPQTKPEKPWLNKGETLDKAIEFLKGGGKLEDIKTKYAINKEVMSQLETVIKGL